MLECRPSSIHRSTTAESLRVPQGDLKITVAGAGILGLWQALTLSRAGHRVRLVDREAVPFSASASRHAGAMIAPYCEAESADPLVRDYGLAAAMLWKEIYPGLIQSGSLVVASSRDQGELKRFARMTVGHETISGSRFEDLEPDLSGRFSTALYYPDESHMTTPNAMRGLLDLARAAGAQTHFGLDFDDDSLSDADMLIDCRGMAASNVLPGLRGVRGERLLIRSRDVVLRRPVRLLHPRHPLYVVPWTEQRFLVGATVIESDDTSEPTVRSALELLGLAYALHPGFGEAEILELSAGVRPAFADNVPRVVIGADDGRIHVNGAFRHGFLLAPVLAEIVRDHLSGKAVAHPLLKPIAAI
jgi:glycine oxidase